MTLWRSAPHTQTTGQLVIVVLVLGAMVAGFWTLFVAGEMLSDPGGWYGLGLVLAWVVPMLGLGALALLRPAWAAPLLIALVALWAAASVLTVVYASTWQEFEDTHGPVGLIVMVALCVPLVALGRTRSLLAGVLLLVVLVIPMLAGVAWVVTGAGLGGTLALVTVGMPFLVLAGLLIIVGVLDRRNPPGGLPAQPQVPGPLARG
ncbi:MAG: hypothetical protein R2737_04045 [Candidatus Nanopelagicales bacterium]